MSKLQLLSIKNLVKKFRILKSDEPKFQFCFHFLMGQYLSTKLEFSLRHHKNKTSNYFNSLPLK